MLDLLFTLLHSCKAHSWRQDYNVFQSLINYKFNTIGKKAHLETISEWSYAWWASQSTKGDDFWHASIYESEFIPRTGLVWNLIYLKKDLIHAHLMKGNEPARLTNVYTSGNFHSTRRDIAALQENSPIVMAHLHLSNFPDYGLDYLTNWDSLIAYILFFFLWILCLEITTVGGAVNFYPAVILRLFFIHEKVGQKVLSHVHCYYYFQRITCALFPKYPQMPSRQEIKAYQYFFENCIFESFGIYVNARAVKLFKNISLVSRWKLFFSEKNVVQFDSTKHRSFSPGTSVSSCSNTGPMRGDPYWTSKENSSGSW